MSTEKAKVVFGNSSFNSEELSSYLQKLSRLFPDFRKLFEDDVRVATYPSSKTELAGELLSLVDENSKHHALVLQYKRGFFMIKLRCAHLALKLRFQEGAVVLEWSSSDIDQDNIELFQKKCQREGLGVRVVLQADYDPDKWLEQ